MPFQEAEGLVHPVGLPFDWHLPPRAATRGALPPPVTPDLGCMAADMCGPLSLATAFQHCLSGCWLHAACGGCSCMALVLEQVSHQFSMQHLTVKPSADSAKSCPVLAGHVWAYKSGRNMSLSSLWSVLL